MHEVGVLGSLPVTPCRKGTGPRLPLQSLVAKKLLFVHFSAPDYITSLCLLPPWTDGSY